MESIEKVYNATAGTAYLTSQYTLKTNSNGVSYLNMNTAPSAGLILLVYVTLDAQYYNYAGIAACRNAVIYGGSYDDRILCWKGTRRGEMFCSRPVTETQVAEAKIWGNTSGDLYFPLDCNFFVGDGRHEIRAVCRHYDRLMVYTDGDAWMADFTDSASERFPVAPINSGIGCTADGAAALAGNEPLTVADGAIRRWKSSSLRRDECSASCISDGIADLFGAQFSTGAIAHSCRGRNEVWFADPSDGTGQVFVYHTGLELWYRFSGIRADGFFPYDDDVAFWRGSSFYRFAEGLDRDTDEDGEREIPAALTLDGLDFGSGERMNHLTRMALRLRDAYPDLTLTLATDRGRQTELAFAAGGASGEVTLIDRAVQSGRFRALRLTLRAAGGDRLRLCGLTLCAEPGTRT